MFKIWNDIKYRCKYCSICNDNYSERYLCNNIGKIAKVLNDERPNFTMWSRHQNWSKLEAADNFCFSNDFLTWWVTQYFFQRRMIFCLILKLEKHLLRCYWWWRQRWWFRWATVATVALKRGWHLFLIVFNLLISTSFVSNMLIWNNCMKNIYIKRKVWHLLS